MLLGGEKSSIKLSAGLLILPIPLTSGKSVRCTVTTAYRHPGAVMLFAPTNVVDTEPSSVWMARVVLCGDISLTSPQLQTARVVHNSSYVFPVWAILKFELDVRMPGLINMACRRFAQGSGRVRC